MKSYTAPFIAIGTIFMMEGALAQPANEDAQSSVRTDGLTEIVVTARRRAEPLQRTPLAVSALSADDIEAKVAVNIVDLAKSMPNVRIDALGSQGRAGMLAIRGVNYARSDATGDPSTAFFIDGLYQTRSTINILDMFDLESIEVLRGPQGTLFGRNAFAGAVNIQTKRPTMEFGGQVEAKLANFDRHELRGAINVPLVDDVLAMRASVLYAESEGYYRSIKDNGKHLGGDDNLTGRLSFLYTPAERWNVYLKYEHVRDRGEPTPAQNASTPAEMAVPGLPAQLMGNIPGDPPNLFNYPKYWTNVNIRPGQKSYVDQDNAALNINYELDGGSITSITGFQDVKDGLFTDPVGGSIAHLTNYYETHVKTISQELRLLKELGDRFQILLGGFYSEDDLTYGNITYSEYTPLLGANAQVSVKQKRDSGALFAELEVRPLDNVRVNFAGRQMWEDKTFFFNRTARPAELNLSPGVFLPTASYDRDSASWDNFSPKISADWRPTQDVMLYTSWTKSFKSGGYAALTTNIALAGPYDPEKIETWEAGVKTFLFDRRLKANLTVFQNNLDDLQRSVNYSIGGVPSNIVFNAASAVTKGVELELEARPLDNLRLTASAGYLKAEYDDFCANFAGTGVQIYGQPVGEPCGTQPGAIDNSGLPLYNAPKWQAAFGGSYEFYLGNAGAITFFADLNYTSSLWTNDTPWPISRRGDMTLVDVNLQWKSASDRFYASVFAHNLFDTIDTQQAIRSSGTLTVFNYTAPRQYGVVAGMKF